MHLVQDWLSTLSPFAIVVIVGLVIATESMGVPLPGEIVLVSAALLAGAGVVSPWAVAVAATTGAIVGDSIGYAVGRQGGRAVLVRFGRRFPRHFGPEHLAHAERIFARWGVVTVFGARFVALLRILAGPLAGALRVPYPRFLAANVSGGVVWAAGTTYALYSLGQAADRWLKGFSWVALVLAVLCGIGTTLLLRRRGRRLLARAVPAPGPSAAPLAPAVEGGPAAAATPLP